MAMLMEFLFGFPVCGKIGFTINRRVPYFSAYMTHTVLRISREKGHVDMFMSLQKREKTEEGMI